MGERKIERQERERERERRQTDRDRGEREKITNTKKFMEFYLVVLHSAERSEARQWIVAGQVSCYNPLSYFNPVTRDKVRKKKIERETGWERERKIQLGGTEFIGGGGGEMDQYLCDHHIKVYYNIEKRKFLAQFQF